MEQNITDLYDFSRTLDEECRNVDLSDVPQTGEKIQLTDAEFFYALFKAFRCADYPI